MRLFAALLLPGLLVFLSPGCTSESPAGASTVTDDLGRSVSLDRPVDRVVSLAPNLTELVYAAGGGSRLVAVTTADDYPPAVDTLTRLSALPVDFEAVAAAEPDLVLATDQINPPGDTDTFAAIDVPVYFFSFSSLDDVFGALRTTGTLLGTEAAARDTARALERQMATLQARTDSIPASSRPRVLVLIGDDTLYSFGQGSYIHTLVAAAGGRSVTADLDAEAPTLSEEYVLTEQPDVIVGAWGADYDPDRLRALHPTWDVVPAVRADRVYSLPPALLLRPGPRLVEGARRMAARLHPDRFEPPPTDSLRPANRPAPLPSDSPSAP
jgi:ABC-type Fe3+-hydroxamate transport system substrate-binding protein